VDASDVGHVPGHFTWPDGMKVDDALKRECYLFGPGKETCLYFSSKSGKLGDLPCSMTSSILCELAAKDQPCH